MDRGSKPPPSHPFVTWACDREAHTTGCVLKGSGVVGTWETGPILGDPCCVEMRTLLQCVCPRHGGDSASVGSLSCHFSLFLFTQSRRHLTLPFSYLFLLFSPLLPSSRLLPCLPPGFPSFLIPALVSNIPFLCPSQSRPLSSLWIHSLQVHALFLLLVHLPK